MTLIQESFRIDGKGERPLNGVVRRPDNDVKYPCLIILHGFKAYKDWGFFPYISENLAASGFNTVTIDFSHNGVIDPGRNIFDVEVFASNSVSRELQDVNILLESLEHGNIPHCRKDKEWDGRIFLLGHSMGGAVSIIAASGNDKISGLCLWAPISKFNRYTKRQRDLWKKTGFVEFENNSTGQTLKLYSSFLEDLEMHDEKFSLPDSIGRILAPILILHGSQDMTVPLKEGELLKDAASGNCELKIIEKAGHVFGIEHPFSVTTNALETLLSLTRDFFDRNK